MSNFEQNHMCKKTNMGIEQMQRENRTMNYSISFFIIDYLKSEIQQGRLLKLKKKKNNNWSLASFSIYS